MVTRNLYDETAPINRIGRMQFADDPAVAVLFESRWSKRAACKRRPMRIKALRQ